MCRGLKSNGVYSGGQEDDASKEDSCWVVMKKNPRGNRNEIIQSWDVTLLPGATATPTDHQCLDSSTRYCGDLFNLFVLVLAENAFMKLQTVKILLIYNRKPLIIH